MKKSLPLILFLMIITLTFAQDNKENIGVCIFTIRSTGGVSGSLGDSLTPLVGLELATSKKLKVMEKSQIEGVLQQQGLSKSGFCDETQCQIEIGKLLNASKIISGDITKLGEKFILTMRVLDVQTGITEYTDKEGCKGGEECLENTVSVLAKRIKTYLEGGKVEDTTTVTQDFSLDKAPDDMILIPAGEFTMGSNDGNDEKPIHKVYLDSYYIDKYEVTNSKYKECVTAGKCKLPDDTEYYNNQSYANHPVVYVDWYSADTYCKWAGKQLPTEAQWEKAARGTESLKYPWGNIWDKSKANNWDYTGSLVSEMANMYKGRGTLPVGSFSSGASPYGVMDMAGNVWEWVSDWYDSNYYKNSPYKNPTGPGSGSYKVLRGGSWFNSNANYLRSANRNYYDPDSSGTAAGSVAWRVNEYLASCFFTSCWKFFLFFIM